MHMQQDKVNKIPASKETDEPAQKAACNSANSTRTPAWVSALGDQPPIGLQAKLTVSQPGDAYEQEADRVADQVMRMPDTGSAPAPGNTWLMRKEHHSSGTTQNVPPAASGVLDSGSGQSMDRSIQTTMEQRFRQDFSGVRVHTDKRAAESARALGARAYTVEREIVFGEGQYKPETSEGQKLLAHELTHVLQQGGTSEQRSPLVTQRIQRQIQRSFFGDLWEDIKSAGRAIGSAASTVGKGIGKAASAVGGAVVEAVKWIGERGRDVLNWATSLISQLPARLVRLGKAIVDGLVGIVTFIPDAISALFSGSISGFAGWLWDKAKSGGTWILTLVDRILDLVGGPEIAELILHLLSYAKPLTAEQIAAGQLVLGKNAISWNQVRVAQGGIWWIIFWLNGNRAVTTFHTINLPAGTPLHTVVHELTHVYQYERAGSIYIGQALHAQATEGAKAYDYGDLKKAGKHFRDFNREQQAQIAEDYFIRLTQTSEPTTEFDPFIAELRAGDL